MVVNAVEARISLGDGMNQTATIRPRGYQPSASAPAATASSLIYVTRPSSWSRLTACEMAQIPRQQKLVLKLARRSQLDMNKSPQLSVVAAAFGNARRDSKHLPDRDHTAVPAELPLRSVQHETRRREDKLGSKPQKTPRSDPGTNAKAQEYLAGFQHCQAIRRVLYSVDFVKGNGAILL